jgi:phosphate-selective porin OprO and OprP
MSVLSSILIGTLVSITCLLGTANAEANSMAATPPSDDSKFAIKITGRGQVRYTLDVPEDDTHGTEQHFAIQRGRIKLSGHNTSKSTSVLMEVGLGKGRVVLKDFYVVYALKKDTLNLKLGQYKKPFLRHQINSSGRLALVDRDITDKALPSGRDIGLSIGNGLKSKNAFTWELGLFNGTGSPDKPNFRPKSDDAGMVTDGEFSNIPEDFRPLAVARAGYNYGGTKVYQEADLKGGNLRFAAFGNAHYDSAATVNAEDPVLVAGIDYILKVQGFSNTGHFFRNMETKVNMFATQAGFVIAKHYQPVIRFAQVDDHENDTIIRELTAGLSIYFFGHKMKLQTDFSMLHTEKAGENGDESRARAQFQLAF